ncbi:hypothetical protein QWI29_21975 [Mycolicibacterium neoaurum]|uniref:hypothetical protein n=1 Tax=Mycolicibacterium neoaurum TaxID=1795 RepID=UPI002672A31A|nr:hypothetical protein [Mycolicibacterium neoaurum]MDO3402717.1 hypothetical protein [Mycolicibacterium neoaurum]
MSRSFWAGIGAALTIGAVCAAPVQAEPLTPPTPGEVQYLEQLRRVFAISHDPAEFRSDGELLSYGRFVCDRRTHGFVGQATTMMPPAITQLAFLYLCPE